MLMLHNLSRNFLQPISLLAKWARGKGHNGENTSTHPSEFFNFTGWDRSYLRLFLQEFDACAKIGFSFPNWLLVRAHKDMTSLHRTLESKGLDTQINWKSIAIHSWYDHDWKFCGRPHLRLERVGNPEGLRRYWEFNSFLDVVAWRWPVQIKMGETYQHDLLL